MSSQPVLYQVEQQVDGKWTAIPCGRCGRMYTYRRGRAHKVARGVDVPVRVIRVERTIDRLWLS